MNAKRWLPLVALSLLCGSPPTVHSAPPPGQPESGDKRYHHPRPPYPYAAFAKSEQGDCVIRLVDDDQGKVVKATVVRSSGSATLDKNSTDFALAQWRGPAKVTWTYTLHYELN